MDAAYWAEQARKYAEQQKEKPADPTPQPPAHTETAQQATNAWPGDQSAAGQGGADVSGHFNMYGFNWDTSQMTPEQYQQFVGYYQQYYSQFPQPPVPDQAPLTQQPPAQAFPIPAPPPPAAESKEEPAPFIHPSRAALVGGAIGAQPQPQFAAPPPAAPPVAPFGAFNPMVQAPAPSFYGVYAQPPNMVMGAPNMAGGMPNMGIGYAGVAGYDMAAGMMPGVHPMGQMPGAAPGMPSSAQLKKLPAWMRDALMTKIGKEQKEKEKQAEMERRKQMKAAVAAQTGMGVEHPVAGGGAGGGDKERYSKFDQDEEEEGEGSGSEDEAERVMKQKLKVAQEKAQKKKLANPSLKDLEAGLDDEERMRLEALKVKWVLLSVLVDVTDEAIKNIMDEVEKGPWMARLKGRPMPKPQAPPSTGSAGTRPAQRLAGPVPAKKNAPAVPAQAPGPLLGLAGYQSDEDSDSGTEAPAQMPPPPPRRQQAKETLQAGDSAQKKGAGRYPDSNSEGENDDTQSTGISHGEAMQPQREESPPAKSRKYSRSRSRDRSRKSKKRSRSRSKDRSRKSRRSRSRSRSKSKSRSKRRSRSRSKGRSGSTSPRRSSRRSRSRSPSRKSSHSSRRDSRASRSRSRSRSPRRKSSRSDDVDRDRGSRSDRDRRR